MMIDRRGTEFAENSFVCRRGLGVFAARTAAMSNYKNLCELCVSAVKIDPPTT